MKNLTLKSAAVIAVAFALSMTAFAQNGGNANGAVNQAGSGSTTNVNVMNTPTVTVVDPGKEPVSIATSITFADGSKSGSGSTYSVPAGKRLVLEQFSLQCYLPSPTYVYGYVDAATPAGVTFPVSLAPSIMSWPLDGAGAYRAVGTTPMHWFQDSLWVKFLAERSGTVGSGSCTATATGYLMPIPQ
jgi:hypothetical protein